MPPVSAAAVARAKARRRNREHVKRATLSDITAEQELEMRHKARKCPLCSVTLTGKLNQPNSKHLDHIIPLNVGGTHSHGNVRITCAACNLKRPKDGSDYAGPVTLWAQGDVPIKRTRTMCRKGLHPWVPSNIDTRPDGKKRCKACDRATARARGAREAQSRLKACKCGALFAAPGSTLMCPECVLTAVRTAADLRMADELSWREIAAQVGYGTATGIMDAVKRTGISLPAKEAKPKPAPAACACGSAAWKHGRCRECMAKAAQRAVHLRMVEGWTLRMIADEIGYSSVSSVTNLMKTVIEVESRIGRPRSA